MSETKMEGQHLVNICVVDAETVADEYGTPSLPHLCCAVRTLQDHGLKVIVLSKDLNLDLSEVQQVSEEHVLGVNKDHLRIIRAFNLGFVDTIRIAAEWEAFYVTNANLRDIETDWRLNMKTQSWLRANHPELHVSFSFDAGVFYPSFANGVIPGTFCIGKSTSPAAPSSGKLEDWVCDFEEPAMAVKAVKCQGTVQKVLAIFGLDEKDPLLQAASRLCSDFAVEEAGLHDFEAYWTCQTNENIIKRWKHGQVQTDWVRKVLLSCLWLTKPYNMSATCEEVEFMRDWRYPVQIPWESLAHVVHVVAGDLTGLWVLGVGSRKQVRRRAGKLALAVMEKARRISKESNMKMLLEAEGSNI